ncbi:MAG: hypothetical protein CMJ70_23745 [Planctomycetaceae bacterium]|nr:hypothetical protein [Planctomycetaceae bacterium]HAA73304.1 hypothetical protein [Planctomycetaceae bacterium]
MNFLDLPKKFAPRQVCRRSLALVGRFADFGFPQDRLAIVPTTGLRSEDRRQDRNETVRITPTG